MAKVQSAGSEREIFSDALRYQRSGRAKKAAKLFERLLERNPHHPEGLLLLGILRSEADDLDGAEALFRRRLADAPTDGFSLHNLAKLYQKRGEDRKAIELYRQAAGVAAFPPTFNDLGVSLHRTGDLADALAAFDRAIALDPDYLMAHTNRGLVLIELDRPAEAGDAFRQALRIDPNSAEAWCHLGTACHKSNDLAGAEAACRRALEIDANCIDAYLQLSLTLDRAHRPEEAEAFGTEWARRQRVLVKPCLTGKPEARVLIIAGSRMCNVPTEHLLSIRRYETITIHLLPPGAASADEVEALKHLPPFDIAFNAIGEVDRGEIFFPEASALCAGLSCPVLNPPEQMPRTRRDRVEALLAGIPNLVVPETRRVRRAELVALAERERLPHTLLLRPLGAHGGDDLQRVETPAEVAAYLREIASEENYVTQYVDYRSADGNYRKYRFVYVDREAFPYHLAISDHWLLHYWRADMKRAQWMRAEEEAFLADYTRIFPGALAETIKEIGRRLDLDYGGVDCGITPDGQVLLFEANATMLVHLADRHTDFAYKTRYVPRIFDAMSAMIQRRIKGG
ncbi:MAG TPA: tetratricopeptide repeat protein [Stellaceae bacterium]|nr:tetratricopeptide repeat protein [Stellaceae bacterium]